MLELDVKFTVSELIQITIGVIQVILAFLALRHQSEAPRPSEMLMSNGGFTFWNSVERFDVFALVVSVSCLILAATISLPSLLPWVERLARFALLAIASAVFTLTIIRVQANKLTKQMTHAYQNATLDGGEF